MPVTFQGVYPIGDTKTNALPVKSLGPAIGYYTRVLGFTVLERGEKSAVLQRDSAQIGLCENSDDPENASCYFSVLGLEELLAEYVAAGIEPSAIRDEVYDGQNLHIFFAQEPYGVCFCFGEKQP